MRDSPLFCIVLFATAVAGGQEPGEGEGVPTAFVTADVLRLRANPTDTAQTVARLRINTMLEVLSKNGDWTQVKIPDTQLLGWVATKMIGPSEVKVDEAREHVRTDTGDERRLWAERLVAIDGGQRAHWEALRSAYAENKRPDRARWVDSILAGKAPGLVAMCIENKLVLLGSFDAAGAIGASSVIDGAPWYRLGTGAPQTVGGSPYLSVETVNLASNQQVSSLGSCDDEGALYASVPLKQLSKAPKGGRRADLDAECARAKGADSDGSFTNSNETWLAPLFGGNLRLRVSRWAYSWSHCEEGDNCGSEQSAGICLGGSGSKVQATVVVTEFGGC